MMRMSAPQLLYNTLEPPPTRYALRAGPLSLDFQGGIFRNVRCGTAVVLQSVYAAVRDVEWGTVPGSISHLSVDTQEASFAVRFRSTHQQRSLHFVWHIEVLGNADGCLRWNAEGTAITGFDANRIGLCVLHPSAFGGRLCRILHTDGTSEQQCFPQSIAPMPIFQNVRELRYALATGTEVSLALEGDVFETEDQRNWGDATYKTYSRPVSAPLPQSFLPQASVSQSIKLDLLGSKGPRSLPASRRPVRLSLQMNHERPSPLLGCALTSSAPISVRSMERLRTLRLNFLLVHAVEVRSADAVRVARELNVPLHVIVSPDATSAQMEAVEREARPHLVRLLVSGTSTAALVAASRLWHRFGVPVAVGSAWAYAGLNRERPQPVSTGGLWFALQPQAHGTDESTLIENLPALGAAVRDAAAWSGGQSILTSIRFRAQLETQHGPGEASDDPRQHSLFGAAWTVGSLKHLCDAGPAEVSIFSASGESGLVLDWALARRNPLFGSVEQDVVSPAYHVLRMFTDTPGARCIETRSSEPLAAEALALRSADQVRVLLTNYTDQNQEVTLLVPDMSAEASVKVLDEGSVQFATSFPEEYARTPGACLRVEDGCYHLTVGPCATHTVQWSLRDASDGVAEGASR